MDKDSLGFSYYLKKDHLDEYDHMTTSLDTALIMRNHRAHVLAFKKEALHSSNMVWKVRSFTQIFQSGIFHGEGATKELWRHR